MPHMATKVWRCTWPTTSLICLRGANASASPCTLVISTSKWFGSSKPLVTMSDFAAARGNISTIEKALAISTY